MKLMETLCDWLLSLPLPRIPYQAVLDLVDNKMRVRHTHTMNTHTHRAASDFLFPVQISGVFLGAELRWVGCQGSRAGLRGYPCSLWTLFHVLTVQHDATPTALENTGKHTHTHLPHSLYTYPYSYPNLKPSQHTKMQWFTLWGLEFCPHKGSESPQCDCVNRFMSSQCE